MYKRSANARLRPNFYERKARVWRVSWPEEYAVVYHQSVWLRVRVPAIWYNFFPPFFPSVLRPLFHTLSADLCELVQNTYLIHLLLPPVLHTPMSVLKGLSVKIYYNVIKNHEERNSHNVINILSEEMKEKRRKLHFFVYFDLFLIVFWYWSTTDA